MSLIDTARSGLAAVRTALEVTSQNLANVNTEGYSRRTVTTAEVAGSAAMATVRASPGSGVSVEGVQRAQDALLTAAARNTAGALAAAQTQTDAATALQSALAPGQGGLPSDFDSFFTALEGLARAPTDATARNVVLQDGQALARGFADLAGQLSGLRGDLTQRAGQEVGQANAILKQLASLQGATMDASALDRRDALLAQLGRIAGIAVTEAADGRVRVNLGTSGGPLLLAGTKAERLSVSTSGPLRLSVAGQGASVMPSTGALAGLAAGLSGLDDASTQLDALAGKVASQMNAANAAGVDQTGARGRAVFGLSGWDVTAGPFNRGNGVAKVTTAPGTAPAGPVTLTRDAAAGLWVARDASGRELARGANALSLPGGRVDLSGSPADGDRLTLTFATGAAHMRFLPSDPGQIAAASARRITADAANTGTATLTVSPADASATGPASLLPLLGTSPDAAQALTFLQAGTVGVIPAGSSTATLATLGTPSTLSASAPSGFGGVSFTLGGTVRTVTLPATMTAEDLAAGLTSGAIVTDDGQRLSGLGVAAVAAGGVLRLSATVGEFTAGLATGPGGSVSATVTASQPPAALQIFTREGRQISGTSLTATQAAALLTPANGFAEGAVYDASYLNQSGYRGLTQTDAFPQGAQVAHLGTSGTAPTVALWQGGPVAPLAGQGSLSLDLGTRTVSLNLPSGATAAQAAALVNAQGLGIRAFAATVATLSAVPDGRLSFTLSGVAMTADVTGGRLDAVASAVNAASLATGVTASLSLDGTRMELRDDQGQDITLTGLRTGTSAGLTVTPEGGSAFTLGATQDSARIGGRLTLTGAASFVAGSGSAMVASAADGYVDGLVSRSVTHAGDVQTVRFAVDEGLDAAGTLYGVDLGNGLQAKVGVQSVSPLTPDGVAAALASSLRAQAPGSSLTGAALATLPAEGTRATVSLSGQTWTLTMTGGTVKLSGPEEGALTASFANGRLVLTARDGDVQGASLIPGAGAAAFGLSSASATVTGQPFTPAAGNTSFRVMVGGTAWDLGVTGSGGAVSTSTPAGFPGTLSFDASTRRLSVTLPASAGALTIPPQSSAAALGLRTAGASLAVSGGALVASGAATLNASVQSLAGDRVALSDLPDEDLVVALDGTGPLRLAGGVTTATASVSPAALDLRVLDAATGKVQISDAATGSVIATRILGTQGTATVAGLSLHLDGGAATGDVFHITPTGAGSADAGNAEAMADLRTASASSGTGGFAALFQTLVSGVATQVNAAQARTTTASAQSDAAAQALSDATAVDLDTEASALVQLQQAYQASAQVLTTARTIFEALLNAM